MLIPFLALQQLILNSIPEVKTCRMWNDNVKNLLAGTDSVYSLDAVFIEFPDEILWGQLGNGFQEVNPLEIKFHYISDMYDMQTGQQDQNLDVFIKTDALRDVLQDYMPSSFTIAANDEFYAKYAGTYTLPFGVFTRSKEIQDKSHSNVYHFVQTYVTSWIDDKRNRPVGGSTAGNLNYELDKVIVWNDTDLYTAQTYVSYTDGNIYKCILDTTAPNTPPTNTTYFKFDRKE